MTTSQDLKKIRTEIYEQQRVTHKDFWIKIDSVLPSASFDKKIVIADLIDKHFNS